MISPTSLQGLAAEYLVCADLCKQGYPAYLAAEGMRYDVVVDAGKTYRIQVKSTAALRHPTSTHKNLTYIFKLYSDSPARRRKPISKEQVDIVALVAMDTGHIAYVSPEYSNKKTVQMKPAGAKRNAWLKQANNIDQFPFPMLLQELAA